MGQQLVSIVSIVLLKMPKDVEFRIEQKKNIFVNSILFANEIFIVKKKENYEGNIFNK